MKQPLYLFFLFLVPLVFLSCGKESPPPEDTAVFFRGHDLAGKEIVIRRPPARIVSLAPSNTEIVFALGAGRRLAGVTSVCDFPPEVDGLTRLGNLGRINLEQIVGLRPDLVLAGNKTDAEALAILERLRIPAAVTEATTFEGTYASILMIGRMLGAVDEAAALVKRMRSETNAVVDLVAGTGRPLCYYVVGFGAGGNWTAGPGSFIHEMIVLGGGRNAAADLSQPWGLFQLEKLLALDPDIVLAGKHTGAPEQLRYEPGYRSLSAVKQNRLVVIDDDVVTRPGPRLAQGLREIARALHPDVFGAEGEP